jgi:hypothetical protein
MMTEGANGHKKVRSIGRAKKETLIFREEYIPSPREKPYLKKYLHRAKSIYSL